MSIEQQRRIGRPPTCTCGECKKCKWAAYMRGWYQRKTEEERRLHISHRSPEALARAEQKRKRPDEHAARERVRLQTRRAIASGKLAKENCERCDSPFTQAHHEDYSQPFAVNWYCPFHHSERHTERALEAGVNR